MASSRLNPIERDISLFINQALSEASQGDILREYAQKTLAEAQERNRAILGHVPDHDTFLDGAKVGSLAGVKASSRITFEFHLLLDVITFVDEMLIIHSPVGDTPKSPEYSRSHVWFADDVEMDPMNPPPAEQYTVLNAVPYARKIERGLSNQAPEGVYEAVATMAKRRYGNVAYVGFSYRSFPGGAVGRWADTKSAGKLASDKRGGDPAKHYDWLTRQPAILIDPGA